MNIAIFERISTYIKNHPVPPQLPFTLNWTRTDGCHSKNWFEENGEPLFSYHTKKEIFAACYNYDEETKLFELATIKINGLTPKENDNRRWEYCSRLFIPKEDKCLYNEYGENYNYTYYATEYRKGTVAHSTHEVQTCLNTLCRFHYDKNLFEENFLALIGNRKKISGNIIPSSYRNNWVIWEWLRYTEKTVNHQKISPTQKKINDFIENYPLGPDEKYKNFATVNRSIFGYYENNAAFYESCKDAHVFRVYNREGDQYLESKRIYIRDGKKEVVIANLNSDGDWVPNGSFTQRQFYCKVAFFETFFENPRYKYLKDILRVTHKGEGERLESGDTISQFSLYTLISIIRNLDIEQIYNMGLPYLAYELSLSGYNSSLNANVTTCLGVPVNNKKNALAKYQTNRNQLSVLNDIYKNCYSVGENGILKRTEWRRFQSSDSKHPFRTLRKLFPVDYVSSLDLETFKSFCLAIVDYFDWNTAKIFSELKHEDKVVLFKRLVAISNKTNGQTNAFKIVDDALKIYGRINIADRPDFNFSQIKTLSDISRFHDDCNEIYAAQMMEMERLKSLKEDDRNRELEKKMAKNVDVNRVHLNYEEDDFIIKLPSKLSEISVEGRVLCHCVGGYIMDHATGKTTILFLRKKSKPDTPFYTIEVRDNVIRQIHGSQNRWLGNNPEAIPCVYRWCQKNNISCSNTILRSTARGYSNFNAPLCDWPAV